MEDKELDFVYTDGSILSCIAIQYGGTQPLATAIVRHNTMRRALSSFDLDIGAGVIFIRADSYNMSTILDLKDKVIASEHYSSLHAGSRQMYEMVKAGLSWVMDPKQFVCTYHNQYAIVHGVLDGHYDVGFVSAGVTEATKDENGNPNYSQSH